MTVRRTGLPTLLLLVLPDYRHYDCQSYRTNGTKTICHATLPGLWMSVFCTTSTIIVSRTGLLALWLSVVPDYQYSYCSSYRTTGIMIARRAGLPALLLLVLPDYRHYDCPSSRTTGTIIARLTGLPALWLPVVPDYRHYDCTSYGTTGIMTVRLTGLPALWLSVLTHSWTAWNCYAPNTKGAFEIRREINCTFPWKHFQLKRKWTVITCLELREVW